MNPLTLKDVARALEQAAEHGAVEARVDMEMVRLPAKTPRSESTHAPTSEVSMSDEEVAYRAFAADLGLDPADDPPMVTMKKSEYLALKAESDAGLALLAEMQNRPPEISAEEQAEYEQYLALIGPI